MESTQELTQLVASLTPEQLQSKAGKALTRRLVRTSFEAWCRFALHSRRLVPAAHHRLVIDILQQVTEGKIKRVMLLMPPGSAKSTYTSVLYTPWNLCVNPHDLVLACSYSYNLIEGFGRECRDLIEKHSEVLGYTLSRSAAAAGDWRINNGIGGYFCAGVNAGIAGHRADKGFIDDYIGTEEEADSKLIRDKNYWWYRNDFCPRLKPDAAQVIMANRRNEDDLVGRLLVEEKDDWLVIKLPMEAGDNDPLGREKGALLWPEWFGMNAEAMKKIAKARQNARTWAGLYQQEPTPEEGDYFKRESILEYSSPSQLPKDDLRIYAGSDWALRKLSNNDETCHFIAGVDSTNRIWILDWFWKRCDTLEAVNEMFRLNTQYKPIVWWHGRENITGSIGPFIKKKMVEENNYIAIEELSESASKEAKAQAIRTRMSAKMVMFPNYLPRWAEMLHLLLTFPGGIHDDPVDGLAKLGQGLAKMTPGSRTKQQWNGILEHERLTCGWLRKSHERRERSERLAFNDN